MRHMTAKNSDMPAVQPVDTELLSACTPLYDTSDPSLELSVLIGAVCMDINLIVGFLFPSK